MPDTKLRLPLGITGWTIYTRLKNESGQIWNSVSNAFVTYLVANIANFKLATPETPAASGDYEAAMPVGLAAGRYSWAHYRLIGSNPVISDPFVGSGGDYWNGTEFGNAPAVVSSNVKKNQALAGFTFIMTALGTHLPKPTATVTARRSLDGADFAPCANVASSVSDGTFKIDLEASDLNANVVMLKFTAPNCDTTFVTIITQP